MVTRARLLAGIAAVLLAACSTGATLSPGTSPSGASPANLASNPASSEATQTGEPSRLPGPSPVEVVQAFYDWYLEGRPMTEVLDRPELSPAFVEFLSGFDGEHDPFACSEELPAAVQAVTSSLSGQTAIVSTIVSPDGVSLEPGPPVDLVLSPTGAWQLEFVGCEAG